MPNNMKTIDKDGDMKLKRGEEQFHCHKDDEIDLQFYCKILKLLISCNAENQMCFYDVIYFDNVSNGY